jgi:ATP-dependent DNA helicase RecG
VLRDKGYLLLGVERDTQDLFNNAYRVVGVAQPDKLQSDLASQCASVFNRPMRPRVSVETLQGNTVLLVEVPEAAPSAASGPPTRRAATTI